VKLDRLQKLVEQFIDEHGPDVADEVVDACDLLIESITSLMEEVDEELLDEDNFEELLNENSEEID